MSTFCQEKEASMEGVLSKAPGIEGLREDRGARAAYWHDVCNLRHRSQLIPPNFLTHRSFCVWQRLQAERTFGRWLVVSLLDKTPAEADDADRGVAKSINVQK